MRSGDVIKKKRLISMIVLILITMSTVLPTYTFAEGEQLTDTNQPDIDFSFSILDYQYSMTVTNNTDLDIVKIKTYDSQFMGEKEKGGTYSYRTLPYAISTEPFIVAGETKKIDITTLIWRDCDRLITYVFYIEFSDGSHWGTEIDTVSSLVNYAKKYEVNYEFTPPPATTSIIDLISQTRFTDKEKTILGGVVLFIIVLIIILVFSEKHKKKSKYQNNQQVTSDSAEENNGKIGEYLAYDALDDVPGNKRLLHNLYIRKPNEETTEIDCLLIHQNGLFVIESKNYKGYIYGSPRDNTWTQVLRKNRHYTFYNPVRQNYGHVKNIMTYLSYATQDQYRKIPVYSIIAFTSTADITNVSTEGLDANTRITHTKDLVATISEIVGLNQTPIISDEDIDRIYEVLRPCTFVSDADVSRHIETISNRST